MKLCLLCLQTKGGHTVPRPLGRTIQAAKPNEVLHFDYYSVGTAYNGWKYVLVLKDGFSHFVELIGCANMTTDVTVEALLDWFKRYNSVPIWVSDQPTHYKNVVLAELAKRLKSSHHFVTAYCPWANGRVERVNRDITALFRQLLAEFKMPLNHWPLVLKMIMSVLNHTTTDSLHEYSPVQLFLGQKPSSPLDTIFNPITETSHTIPPTGRELGTYYKTLRLELDHMHAEVKEQSDKTHQRNAQQRSSGTLPNFAIGDFVLWSSIDSSHSKNKLQFIWRGPFRILNALSDYIFEIGQITKDSTHTVHCSRLKYFHDLGLNLSPELLQHINNQEFVYKIERIVNFRWNTSSKRWEFEILWQGFPGENSWEPFLTLLQDVPEILCAYLHTNTSFPLRKLLLRRHKPDLLKMQKKAFR